MDAFTILPLGNAFCLLTKVHVCAIMYMWFLCFDFSLFSFPPTKGTVTCEASISWIFLCFLLFQQMLMLTRLYLYYYTMHVFLILYFHMNNKNDIFYFFMIFKKLKISHNKNKMGGGQLHPRTKM